MNSFFRSWKPRAVKVIPSRLLQWKQVGKSAIQIIWSHFAGCELGTNYICLMHKHQLYICPQIFFFLQNCSVTLVMVLGTNRLGNVERATDAKGWWKEGDCCWQKHPTPSCIALSLAPALYLTFASVSHCFLLWFQELTYFFCLTCSNKWCFCWWGKMNATTLLLSRVRT